MKIKPGFLPPILRFVDIFYPKEISHMSRGSFLYLNVKGIPIDNKNEFEIII